MPELKEFAGSIAVIVSSCDAFFDAWRPFAYFLRQRWPDCPFPVYLITNQLQIRSNSFQAVRVGEDRGWASNMKHALMEIAETHVLYFQEDYFLEGPVSSTLLTADLQEASLQNADAFCFRARSELEPKFQKLNERFGIVPLNSDGRTRCQLTLWKRDAFLSVLREGETAWEMESRGSERTRDLRILSYHTREGVPIPYLMSAIVRGLWTKEALGMCAHAGVPIAPHFRGTYSANRLLQRIRRAQTRARLARELAQRASGFINLDALEL